MKLPSWLTVALPPFTVSSEKQRQPDSGSCSDISSQVLWGYVPQLISEKLRFSFGPPRTWLSTWDKVARLFFLVKNYHAIEVHRKFWRGIGFCVKNAPAYFLSGLSGRFLKGGSRRAAVGVLATLK